MSTSETLILAGVLPDRQDRLIWAMPRLDSEWFSNEARRTLYLLLLHYYDRAQGVLPREIFDQQIDRSLSRDPSKHLHYSELFTALAERSVSDPEFRWAVHDVNASYLTSRLGRVVADSAAMLDGGFEVDGETLQGQEQTREYLSMQLAQIEASAKSYDTPEGDVRHEMDEMWDEYSTAKLTVDTVGIRSGIGPLDSMTGGWQPGELVLVAASTGVGKSQFAVQVAWHTAVMEGRGVVYLTNETSRDTIRRRIVARHSRHPKFALTEGLDSQLMRSGKLDADGERMFVAVAKDFRQGDYGRLWVGQLPTGSGVEYIRGRVAEVARKIPVDLVVVDYLALMRGSQRRQSRREELNDILTEAKSMAINFSDGKGVPLVSPWQIGRVSHREAKQRGEYDLTGLAETAEAERSADCVFTLYAESPSEIKLQMLKNRDGPVGPAFRVQVDFRSSYFESPEATLSGAQMEDLI